VATEDEFVQFAEAVSARLRRTAFLPCGDWPASPANAYDMVIAPNGKTLYVISTGGVFPIRTASGTLLPTIRVPYLYSYDPIAITPDSRTIYVGAEITKGTHKVHGFRMPVIVARGVIPISTATNTAGRFINLGGDPFGITFAR
jgi:hypothetical protein